MNDIKTILAAQNGGKDALEELVTENTPLVWSIVRRFCGRGCEAEDLFQIGCIGLIKAIRALQGTTAAPDNNLFKLP